MGQSVYAKDGKGKKGRERFKKMAEELNLSEEQMAKIKEIRKKYRSELKDLRSKKKYAQSELQELMSSGNKGSSFQGKAKSKHSELQAFSNQLHDKRFNMMLEIREELSSEQIKEFKEFRENKKAKRRALMKEKQKESDD